jgi:site-specific DNA-methyltransferase (adenine-specific)
MDAIYNEDCLVGMQRIPDQSIDMILCDLPYGTTQNKWDSVIPLAALWEQYKRLIKPQGAVVLTAQVPFSVTLAASNLAWLKYEWIWEKEAGSGFLNAKKYPLKSHENVLVFAERTHTYHPQMTTGTPYVDRRKQRKFSENYGSTNANSQTNSGWRYPKTVLRFRREYPSPHPTAKPVALFEYLIRTYTNPGEVVLDNAIGSGTTAIAAMNAGRHYIGFEKDQKYFEVARKRIEAHKPQLKLLEQTA